MAEPKTAIGIHFAGKLLHRAQIVRSGSQLRLVTLQTGALPSASEAIAPVDGAAAAGIDTRVVVALPAVDAMTRCWPLPNGERGRLRQMLANRLEAESPIPIEELAWNYRTGEGFDGPGSRLVLVQATRNSRIAQHLRVLRSAGCRPDVLTTEAEAFAALARHAFSWQPSAAELLVFAAESEWTVCLLAGGLVRCLRRVGLDAAQPELACRQIGRMVECELSQTPLRRIGWCGALGPAAECLTERLNAPIEQVQTIQQLVKSDGAQLTPNELQTYGPAIGLALAGILDDRDLLMLMAARHEEPRRSRMNWVFAHPWRWTVAAAAMCAIAVLVHVLILRHETRLMQAVNQSSATPLADLGPKVRAMQRLERYRIDVEGAMAELARTIPSSVLVQSLQLARERRLSIKGTSKDPKAIYGWVEALRKSDRFSEVNPERTAPSQGGDFTIAMELNGVEKLTAISGRGGTWR